MNRVEMKKKLMAAGLSAMITVGTVAPALVGGLAGTPMAACGTTAVFGTGGQPAAAVSFPAFGAAAVFGTGGTPAAAKSILPVGIMANKPLKPTIGTIAEATILPEIVPMKAVFGLGGVPAGASIVCTFAMGGVPAGA